LFYFLLTAVLVAGCATAHTYTGTFTGLGERKELYTRDGKVFPVTEFTVESPKGKIRIQGSPRWPLPAEWHPRVILVDSCYTAYPPERYAGKKLEVLGTIQNGKTHPFPSGPELRLDSAGVLIVERIAIDRTAEGQGMEIIQSVKPVRRRP